MIAANFSVFISLLALFISPARRVGSMPHARHLNCDDVVDPWVVTGSEDNSFESNRFPESRQSQKSL
jgi:hypothetical protein